MLSFLLLVTLPTNSRVGINNVNKDYDVVLSHDPPSGGSNYEDEDLDFDDYDDGDF